jgi:outer membrane protein assembly factor BamD (BamD/ComL family)
VLSMLEALDRDHPRGVLQPERAALRVFATCAAGAIPRARVLAASFVERYPGSPMIARVRNACAEDPPPP